MSHSVWQQKVSRGQTSAQQAGSLQPGEAWMEKQLATEFTHAPRQMDASASTQNLSQPNSPMQQAVSIAQTASQQAASLQPRLVWMVRQLPDIGLPQTSKPSMQSPSASAAQKKSQTTLQQTGSAAQTRLQQSRFAQPGVALSLKQSPWPGHASNPQETRNDPLPGSFNGKLPMRIRYEAPICV
jgi:hypothetical protein